METKNTSNIQTEDSEDSEIFINRNVYQATVEQTLRSLRGSTPSQTSTHVSERPPSAHPHVPSENTNTRQRPPNSDVSGHMGSSSNPTQPPLNYSHWEVCPKRTRKGSSKILRFSAGGRKDSLPIITGILLRG